MGTRGRKKDGANQRQQSVSKAQKRRIRLLFCFLFLFMVWAGYTWYAQNGILKDKKAQLAQLRGKLEQLEKERAQLQGEVKKLHDEEYIAEIARKYFFLSRPGEIIFVTPE
ncbi:hypothetical protein BSNK01_10400 [Bacillaceae bacterium]